LTATITRGLTYAEYRDLPGWSWSVIKHMAISPLACLHAKRMIDREGDTKNRALLRAIHALVLEPDNFARQFSVFDGRRAGAKYDAHVAQYHGTDVLNLREHALARATADAVRNHEIAGPLFSEGEGEVVVTWRDDVTGLPLKARIDWLGLRLFLDLKTLGTTDERVVAKRVAGLQIHGQMAHYDAGLRAAGLELPAFLVVAEGKGAQDVSVFSVDEGIPDGSLHVGREHRAGLLARLSDCVQDDRWPGRHEAVVDLCLPNYALIDPEIEGGSEDTFEEASP
jgi:hypothetical protein